MTHAERELNVERVELRDSLSVERIVVHDTLTITKMITVRENEHGDTLRVTTVTDRDRIRDAKRFWVQDSRVMVKTDTVYVAVRDSVVVEDVSLKTHGENVSWGNMGLMVLMVLIGGIIVFRFKKIKDLGKRIFNYLK